MRALNSRPRAVDGIGRGGGGGGRRRFGLLRLVEIVLQLWRLVLSGLKGFRLRRFGSAAAQGAAAGPAGGGGAAPALRQEPDDLAA